MKKTIIDLNVFKQYVEEFKKSNNRTPGLRDLYIHKGCPYSKSLLLKQYENLSVIYDLIGEDRCITSRIVDKDKEQLANELKNAIYSLRTTDRDMLRKKFHINDRSVYERVFGSWSNALEYIGFDNRNRTLMLYFKNYNGENPIEFLKNEIGVDGNFTKEQLELIKSPKPGIRKIRKLFATKTIFDVACGKTPNSIRGVTMKHLAKDGHYCDSEREMIVDNWLFDNGYNHEVHITYPNSNMICDFKIKDVYIEYAGYCKGEGKRIETYNEKLQKKIQYAKDNNIKLLIVYKTDNKSLEKLGEQISGIIQ